LTGCFFFMVLPWLPHPKRLRIDVKRRGCHSAARAFKVKKTPPGGPGKRPSGLSRKAAWPI
jgi:hypothetical protein